MASNVFGRLVDVEDFTSNYFAQHVRQPVRFRESIQDISEKGGFRHSVCLEIGPHPVVLPMMRDILSNDCILLPTLQRDPDVWLSISTTLSQLSLAKNDINWRAIFEGSQGKMTSLPGYPLSNTSFMNPYQEDSNVVHPLSQSHETGFNLLPRSMAFQSSEDTVLFETTLAVLEPLISGHNVGGSAICPASVYHEIFLEAASRSLSVSGDQHLAISNMTFLSPLIYEASQEGTPIYVHFTRSKTDHSAKVMLTIGTSKDSKTTLCCKAVVSIKSVLDTKSLWLKEEAMIKRQSLYINNVNRYSKFQSSLLYETISTRVVRYSKEYQTLIDLSVSDFSLEGIGSFKLPKGVRIEGYIVIPSFTDTLLHAAGFIANLKVRSDEICICTNVESIEILHNSIDFGETFKIYCSLIDVIEGSILANAFAANSTGNIVAVVRSMEFKKLQLTSFHSLLQSSMKTQKISSLVEDGRSSSESSTGTSSPNFVPTPMTPDNNHQTIRKTLFGILSDASGFPEQHFDSSKHLAELGIDSLMQIEIASKLEQAFPGSAVDRNSLTQCDMIQAFSDTLVSVLVDSGDDITHNSKEEDQVPHEVQRPLERSQDRNPVTLHTSYGEAAPLYLFHDGSGQVSVYAKMINVDRSLHAFFDPDFSTQKSLVTSLTQLAKRYCTCLSKSRTSPLIVGGMSMLSLWLFFRLLFNFAGWSFGGVVAFEAARQLSLIGFHVKGLVLIDSPYPHNHQPLPREIVFSILDRLSPDDGVKPDLLNEFHKNGTLLGEYSPPSGRPIKTIMLRSRDTLDTDALCGVRYDWLSSQKARDDAINGWEQLVGGNMEVLEIPGNHFQAFDKENASALSLLVF